MDERGAVDLSGSCDFGTTRTLLGPDGRWVAGVRTSTHTVHRLRLVRLDPEGNPIGPGTVHDVRATITTTESIEADPCVPLDTGVVRDVTVRFC